MYEVQRLIALLLIFAVILLSILCGAAWQATRQRKAAAIEALEAKAAAQDARLAAVEKWINGVVETNRQARSREAREATPIEPKKVEEPKP